MVLLFTIDSRKLESQKKAGPFLNLRLHIFVGKELSLIFLLSLAGAATLTKPVPIKSSGFQFDLIQLPDFIEQRFQEALHPQGEKRR